MVRPRNQPARGVAVKAGHAGALTDAPLTDAPRTVAVPAYAGTLEPVPRERVRALRRYLVAAMRAERELRPRDRRAPQGTEAPDGFTGRVAGAACALCGGWCCSKGGDHAYLDEHTLVRVRAARPALDARGVLRLYEAAIARPGYARSCVFHGALGCTLDRDLRSDLCNRYFCNGLAAFVRRGPAAASVRVVAGGGQDSRVSPVLTAGDGG